MSVKYVGERDKRVDTWTPDTTTGQTPFSSSLWTFVKRPQCERCVSYICNFHFGILLYKKITRQRLPTTLVSVPCEFNGLISSFS